MDSDWESSDYSYSDSDFRNSDYSYDDHYDSDKYDDFNECEERAGTSRHLSGPTALRFQSTACSRNPIQNNRTTTYKRENPLADALMHLFLFKKTPDKVQENLEEIESCILQTFSTSIKSTVAEAPYSHLYPIVTTFEKWEEMQPKLSGLPEKENTQLLQTALSKIENGRTIPIYVRKQNCTIHFTKQANADGLRVITFRSSLAGEIVMSTVKEPSMEFPETVETIQNTGLLGSATFAKQIYELADGKIDISMGKTTKGGREYRDTRDVANPCLVSDWIVGLLAPKSETKETASTYKKFCKKVRDQITFSTGCSNSLPFRRSGMYMSLKVTLQMQLLEFFDYSWPQSKLVYKILMLRVLAGFAKTICDEYNEKIDMDTGAQILAKLGRRVKKLEKLHLTESFDETEETIKGMLSNCYDFTYAIVEQLNAHVYAHWDMAINPKDLLLEEQKSTAADESTSRENYLQHELVQLDNFIGTLQTSGEMVNISPSHSSVRNNSKENKRYITSSSIILYSNASRSFLYDTENYIKYNYMAENPGTTCIAEITRKYLQEARNVYKDDPVGMSQLFLVALKSMEIMDRQVTSNYPLLLEYTPEINVGPFDYLLLPYKEDMDMLDALVDYFKTRGTNAKYKILDKAVNSNCFAVRYAEGNSEMALLREGILVDIQTNIDKKFAEIDASVETCRNLQSKINKEGYCKCEYETKSWVARNGKWRTRRNRIVHCDKCKLETQLKNERISVDVYERPLPPVDEYQWAVVFELAVPTDFSVWRDYLAFFKYEILGETVFNRDTSKDWLDYSDLSEYKSASKSHMSLGSSSLPSSNTYHTKTQDPDVLTNQKEDFIVWNGMGCIYRYKSQDKSLKCLKAACAFQLGSVENSVPYKNLQSRVEDWQHTENDVIASQYQCHHKLSLREFISFGSVRAGNRIQLRNLYEAIFSEALSLDQESVFALILQTAWQIGPRSVCKQRESHLDFEDTHFAEEFIEMLDTLVMKNKVNYGKSLVIFIAVVLVCRISELNKSLQDTCYTKLREWRSILASWMNKIQAEIDRQSAEVFTESGIMAKLVKNMLEVTLCSIFSYNVFDETKIRNVIRDKEDVTHYLRSIYHLNELLQQSTNTSEFLKNILHYVKLVPIRLAIQDENQVGRNLLQQSIQNFIAEKWNKVNELQLSKISFQDKDETVVEVTYKNVNDAEAPTSHSITIDLYDGSFLVNGNTPSALPARFQRNKLFQKYFKNCGVLRVQQDAANIFRTQSMHYERHYEFFELVTPSTRTRRLIYDGDGFGDKIIIKEIQQNSSRLILLDPDIFSGSISHFFIKGYTHWLDDRNGIVYFRPESARTDKDRPHDYILQQTKIENKTFWTFQNVHSGEYIFSILSKGFNTVVSILHSLEMGKYINVTLNKADNVTTVAAHRYNIKFTVRSLKVFESIEYPGYKILTDGLKHLDTLIGLRQGILLENAKQQQILLVPHSEIKIIARLGSHQNTMISLETLKEPACFVYEIDPVLKRLKPYNSKTAWLYFAALHAVTSSSLPDPFTAVTGTEMAVRILQSACVWSCSSYDKESLSILKFIHGLSPKHTYYGKPEVEPGEEETGSMEIIDWPEGLPSMIAYDGYALIVSTLLRESQQLAALHSDNVKIPKLDKSSDKLRIRAYTRYLSMYNPAVSVRDPDYFSTNQLSLLRQYESPNYYSLRASAKGFNIDNLVTISLPRFTNSIWELISKSVFRKNNLLEFLIKDEPLDAPNPEISTDALQDLFHLDFRYNWLKLYNMAIECSKSQEKRHLFTTILCALAYRGEASMEQVANLHCISMSSTNEFPPAPNFQRPSAEATRVSLRSMLVGRSTQSTSWLLDALNNHGEKIADSISKYYCYPKPSSNCYEMATIENILLDNALPYTEMERPTGPELNLILKNAEEYEAAKEKYTNDLKLYQEKKAKYEEEMKASCVELNGRLSREWPSDKIEKKNDYEKLFTLRNIKTYPTIHKIDECLSIWYRNYKLKLFVENVQEKLNEIFDKESPVKTEVHASPLKTFSATINFMPPSKLGMDIGQLADSSLAAYEDEAETIYSTEGYSDENANQMNEENWIQILIANRQRYQDKITKILQNTSEMLTGNVAAKIILKAGISPRIAPLNILQLLLSDQPSPLVIQSYAGALGVLWTHVRRIDRCIRMENFSAVQRELQNPGHTNWIPKQHPEWLLLELELNITIRPIQVTVARQMIKMPDDPNGVTQLNMGEGKTSVIVPMVCSTLAIKDTQLCRVTVLSSMFKMNLTSLSFAIGGLLGRRMYTMPCKRDLQIDDKVITQIQNAYQNCLQNQGVVLTLPEHRLSFRLLAYDKILKHDVALGTKMLKVENWLRYYARDVLDESDELFNVKYQLVYTIGDQNLIDGGDVRWILCQKILGWIHTIGKEFTPNEIEMNENRQKQNPHEFSTIRLLSTGCVDKFMEMLADRLLEEMIIKEKEKQLVKDFLLKQNVNRDVHVQVMQNIFKEDPENLQKVMLMSGYLRRGVLVLALMKRWRVEYGIHPKQGFRRMAVPYRAKDVAADKTEFGHPDLAIILTHLSYYYSGLSDIHLQGTFDILKGKQSPDALYSKWIEGMPTVEAAKISSNFYSLNMADKQQKSNLFDALRKHKMVIDFWLSNCVFPRESRQFPGKLVMTAWDLCYERQRFAVTGFSGTNDSKMLLPLTITQQDLPQLEETNENMNKTLLGPENNGHKALVMAVTCENVLKEMMNDNLTVLVDAGALMLELSNQQVAQLWLKVNSNIEAVVYFNKDNELLVMGRDEKGEQGTSFDVSPYQSRLGKCGVFLDDQHTRGTDLKFPAGSKACVTIGTRMKRDKLIQACMRMRKLGDGHSVTFYLSYEAHNNINPDGAKREISTQAVLDWVTENTKHSSEDGLLYWAQAGRNYAQRLAAEDNFYFPHYASPFQNKCTKNEEDVKILANQCVDDEAFSLVDMYGQYTQVGLLVNLIPKWFTYTKQKLLKKNANQNMQAHVIERFDEIGARIRDRCLLLVPEKKHVSGLSMMEEEQEKELEMEKEVELEEERIIERPRQAEAAKPCARPSVKRCILKSGNISLVGLDGAGIVRLCDTFMATSFWNEVQPECWDRNVFATTDFVTVIKNMAGSHHKTDAHLRPIKYLASFCVPQQPGRIQLLVLSSFEVNEWMPYFKSSQAKCTLHMFSTRRREWQDVLLNKTKLQLPSLPRNVGGTGISESSMEMASILLASGNLYFVSMEEQKAFTRFLGLALQPWSAWEQKAVDKGMITKTGFLLPEYRQGMKEGFEKDPVSLIKKILTCRHCAVSDVVHLLQLLEEKRYIEMP